MSDPPAPDKDVFAAFPRVALDRDNIEHYRGLLARRLLVNRCSACGWWIYPHRPMCPQCWSWEIVPTEVSGMGTVFMSTLIHQVRDADSALGDPIPAAAVELAEQAGLRYLARVVNCPPHEVRPGMAVRLAWIEEEGHPSPVFVPAGGGGGP